MPTIEAPRSPTCRNVFLTKAELELAYRRAKPVLRDFIVLAYFTGARRGALEALTPAQIDFTTRTISLMP
jgi:integrase